MLRLLLFGLFALGAALTARAEPTLKIINFTADWCPNCQVLNPRIDEAISGFEASAIERVDLDMTNAGRRAPMARSAKAIDTARQVAADHRASELWEWYGGITGIAVIIAADTGEPISCIMRPMTSDTIHSQLRLAKILTENARPGTRRPDQLPCPPPRRG